MEIIDVLKCEQCEYIVTTLHLRNADFVRDYEISVDLNTGEAYGICPRCSESMYSPPEAHADLVSLANALGRAATELEMNDPVTLPGIESDVPAVSSADKAKMTTRIKLVKTEDGQPNQIVVEYIDNPFDDPYTDEPIHSLAIKKEESLPPQSIPGVGSGFNGKWLMREAYRDMVHDPAWVDEAERIDQERKQELFSRIDSGDMV